MLLLFFTGEGTAVTPNNTYFICSSTDPDVLDMYCDGVLTGRLTVA